MVTFVSAAGMTTSSLLQTYLSGYVLCQSSDFVGIWRTSKLSLRTKTIICFAIFSLIVFFGGAVPVRETETLLFIVRRWKKRLLELNVGEKRTVILFGAAPPILCFVG